MPALTDDDLATLLRSGESDRAERKRNAADLDRIREAICAFANDLPDRGNREWSLSGSKTMAAVPSFLLRTNF
jgi:ATP-dependent DNA helicase RecG